LEDNGVVDEADRVVPVRGAGDDQDDRPAGGDVDGGQLVHLDDALEVAAVEAVHRHQMAWCWAVVTGGVGGQPSGRCGDRRGPATRWARRLRPWSTSSFCTIVELGEAVAEPIVY
jgi:hypothetical protein